VLSGDDAVAARDAVAELAEALWEDEDEPASDPSLAFGAAGVAIFLHYAAATEFWPHGSDAATALLQRAVSDANERGLGPELYGGTVGTAWAVAHTQPAAAANVVAGSVDAGLADFIDRRPTRAHFDLISGVVGHGVYALERLPEPGSAELAERIVDRLAADARPADGGIAWPSESPGEGNADGAHLNLGMAHGSPGVIAFLASCHGADIARSSVEELLPAAVAWLLAQRLDDGAFPYWVESGVEAAPARTAWCYGDPGVAIALLRAARALGRGDWEAAAREQARAAADLPPERTGVEDSGLCHGAMGLAHLFGRLSAATGDERYADAARKWIAWTFERRAPGRGLAGFLTLERDLEGRPHEAHVRGFLTGAAGIGLALAAAASDLEPDWDRLMLASFPSESRLDPRAGSTDLE
jgi:hypothetical protein